MTLRGPFYEAAPHLQNWLDQGHMACVNTTKPPSGSAHGFQLSLLSVLPGLNPEELLFSPF